MYVCVPPEPFPVWKCIIVHQKYWIYTYIYIYIEIYFVSAKFAVICIPFYLLTIFIFCFFCCFCWNIPVLNVVYAAAFLLFLHLNTSRKGWSRLFVAADGVAQFGPIPRINHFSVRNAKRKAKKSGNINKWTKICSGLTIVLSNIQSRTERNDAIATIWKRR